MKKALMAGLISAMAAAWTTPVQADEPASALRGVPVSLGMRAEVHCANTDGIRLQLEKDAQSVYVAHVSMPGKESIFFNNLQLLGGEKAPGVPAVYATDGFKLAWTLDSLIPCATISVESWGVSGEKLMCAGFSGLVERKAHRTAFSFSLDQAGERIAGLTSPPDFDGSRALPSPRINVVAPKRGIPLSNFGVMPFGNSVSVRIINNIKRNTPGYMPGTRAAELRLQAQAPGIKGVAFYGGAGAGLAHWNYRTYFRDINFLNGDKGSPMPPIDSVPVKRWRAAFGAIFAGAKMRVFDALGIFNRGLIRDVLAFGANSELPSLVMEYEKILGCNNIAGGTLRLGLCWERGEK